jgi:hypothetical protein
MAKATKNKRTESIVRADTRVPTTTPAGQKPQVGNVGFRRQEVLDLEKQYVIIKDCLAGEITVKSKLEDYLPKPNASDDSAENKTRYDAYVKRANFVNFTKRTLAGLIGTIFLRDPVIEVPNMLDFVKSDFTGSGISVDQAAAMLAANDLAFGRAGLFVDYPDTKGPATVAQVQAGKIRPSVVMYDAWQIINWRFISLNGRTIPSLIVLTEMVLSEDDGYETTFKKQWRVLKLEKQLGVAAELYFYVCETYEEAANGYSLTGRFEPVDASRQRFTEIPFQFVGVNNNDANPDQPPLYDLASTNIAHYRNSADYEEACFMLGQPTPWFAGLTEEWVTKVLKGKVMLGSRAAVLLPANASAGLLQANENSMPKEAMEMKERQMVALGAKLVEQKSVQRTATEANQDEAADNSVLASVAKNVAAGIVQALNGAQPSSALKAKISSINSIQSLTLQSCRPTKLRSLLRPGRLTALRQLNFALRFVALALRRWTTTLTSSSWKKKRLTALRRRIHSLKSLL